MDKKTNNDLYNVTQKTKGRTTGTTLKPWCSGRLGSFCSTSVTHRATAKRHWATIIRPIYGACTLPRKWPVWTDKMSREVIDQTTENGKYMIYHGFQSPDYARQWTKRGGWRAWGRWYKWELTKHLSHLHDKYGVIPADKNPNYFAVLLLKVRTVDSRKLEFAVCIIDTILYEYYS
jgi:hypothetical protein